MSSNFWLFLTNFTCYRDNIKFDTVSNVKNINTKEVWRFLKQNNFSQELYPRVFSKITGLLLPIFTDEEVFRLYSCFTKLDLYVQDNRLTLPKNNFILKKLCQIENIKFICPDLCIDSIFKKAKNERTWNIVKHALTWGCYWCENKTVVLMRCKQCKVCMCNRCNVNDVCLKCSSSLQQALLDVEIPSDLVYTTLLFLFSRNMSYSKCNVVRQVCS